MSFEEAAVFLGTFAGVAPKGGKWDSIASITKSQQDNKMRVALRRIKTLVDNRHIEELSREFPPASARGEYPAMRTGRLRDSYNSVIQMPKNGQRKIRFEYRKEYATTERYSSNGEMTSTCYYPAVLFSKDKLGRKSVEDTLYEMIDEIHDILQVPFDVTPLEDAF